MNTKDYMKIANNFKQRRSDEEFIDFLRKELIEMMFERTISSEDMIIYHKIISKWEKQYDNT